MLTKILSQHVIMILPHSSYLAKSKRTCIHSQTCVYTYVFQFVLPSGQRQASILSLGVHSSTTSMLNVLWCWHGLCLPSPGYE